VSSGAVELLAERADVWAFLAEPSETFDLCQTAAIL
jgi:hypothetical protein